MPRIKEVLRLVRRRYAQARSASTPAVKKIAPPVKRRRGPKVAAMRGVEITQAVFPNKR